MRFVERERIGPATTGGLDVVGTCFGEQRDGRRPRNWSTTSDRSFPVAINTGGSSCSAWLHGPAKETSSKYRADRSFARTGEPFHSQRFAAPRDTGAPMDVWIKREEGGGRERLLPEIPGMRCAETLTFLIPRFCRYR